MKTLATSIVLILILLVQEKECVKLEVSSRISTSSSLDTYLQSSRRHQHKGEDGFPKPDGIGPPAPADGIGPPAPAEEAPPAPAKEAPPAVEEEAAAVDEVTEKEETDQLAVQKEGWLMVSSESYNDPLRFPTVRGKETNSFKMVSLSPTAISVTASPAPPVPFNFRVNQQYPTNSIPSASAFYFRLSSKNLYYSGHATDLVVLGALQLNNIDSLQPAPNAFSDGFCFSIKDSELDSWVLCADSSSTQSSWECAIKTQLGLSCSPSPPPPPDGINIAQPVYVISTASPYCNQDWNYKKQGTDWECLCREGQQQSPVDLIKTCQIPGGKINPSSMMNSSAIFQFQQVKASDFHMVYEDYTVKLKSKQDCTNGPDCKTFLLKVIDTDYSEFVCSELSFHTPSEHTIEGQHFPMEIQTLCRPISQQAFMDVLILSWLVKNTPGGTNQFMDKLNVLDLPTKTFPTKPLPEGDLNLQGMFLNDQVSEFFDSFSYYQYSGSLTQPQCDQHVRWILVAEPLGLGISLFQMFNDANGKKQKQYTGDYRSVQPLNGRTVYFFDAETSGCGKPTVKKQEISGHFEKYESKLFNMFYLDGQKHSGLKESKLVSDEKLTKIKSNLRDIPNISKLLSSK